MAGEPIPITRAEYAAKFGGDTTSAPIPISRRDYAAKFGSVGENALAGLTDAPQAIMHMPGAIYDMGKDVVQTVASPVDAVQSGQAERALRQVGGLSAGIAGAGTMGGAGATLGALGGPLAWATVPAGAIIGGGLGFGAGLLGFNQLLEATGVDEATTPQEQINRLAYDTTQGAAMGGTVGALAKGTGAAIRGGQSVYRAAARPLTEAGREAITADAIRQLAQTDQINIPPASGLRAERTLAEVTGNPGLASAEKTLARTSPELTNVYANKVQGREAARDATLNKVSAAQEAIGDMRGAVIREGLQENLGALKDKVSAAYEKLPLDTEIPIWDAKVKIQDLKKTISPKQNVFDAELNGLFEDLVTAPQNKLLLRDAQGLRSRALEIVRRETIALGGQMNAKAMVASRVASELESSINQAGGLASKQWAKANELRATQAELFQNKLLKALTDSSTRAAAESALPERILKSPENVAAFKKAAGKNTEIVSAMRDYTVGKFRNLSDTQKVSFFEKHKAQLEELFPQASYARMRQVIEDIKSARDSDALATIATKGRSPTAQIIAQDRYLSRIFAEAEPRSAKAGIIEGLRGAGPATTVGAALGYMGGSPLLGALLGLTGKLVSKQVYAPAYEAIKRQAFDALLDPQYARQLLKANPASAPASLGALESLPTTNVLTAALLGAEKQKALPAPMLQLPYLPTHQAQVR